MPAILVTVPRTGAVLHPPLLAVGSSSPTEPPERNPHQRLRQQVNKRRRLMLISVSSIIQTPLFQFMATRRCRSDRPRCRPWGPALACHSTQMDDHLHTKYSVFGPLRHGKGRCTPPSIRQRLPCVKIRTSTSFISGLIVTAQGGSGRCSMHYSLRQWSYFSSFLLLFFDVLLFSVSSPSSFRFASLPFFRFFLLAAAKTLAEGSLIVRWHMLCK